MFHRAFMLGVSFFCVIGDTTPGYAHEPNARFTLQMPSRDGNAAEFDKIQTTASAVLLETSEEYGRIFGFIEAPHVNVRFLTPEEFTQQTGAPSFSSAIYLRNHIYMQLISDNEESLRRTLRHEYLHAVTAELSGIKCPAWIDEGLAQYFEGLSHGEVEDMRHLLSNWLRTEKFVPFSELEGNFTLFSQGLARVAYAEAFFATRMLIQRHGFGKMKQYLGHLKSGLSSSEAFQGAFGMDIATFELEFASEWAPKLQVRGVASAGSRG